MRISGKALLGLVLQHEGGKQETDALACAPRRRAGSLNGMRVGADQWVRLEGWLDDLPIPWWCYVWGSWVVPWFCSQHLRSGSWFVAFLYLIVHNCPNCSCLQWFLAPYRFFVFCCSRRHLPWCKWKHSHRGSQVPAYLNSNSLLPPGRYLVNV